jgi:hypothetical protein
METVDKNEEEKQTCQMARDLPLYVTAAVYSAGIGLSSRWQAICKLRSWTPPYDVLKHSECILRLGIACHLPLSAKPSSIVYLLIMHAGAIELIPFIRSHDKVSRSHGSVLCTSQLPDCSSTQLEVRMPIVADVHILVSSNQFTHILTAGVPSHCMPWPGYYLLQGRSMHLITRGR